MAETTQNPGASGQGPAPEPRPPSRLRKFAVRWLIRLGILAALVIVALIVAEHKTSQPEFCASCHIMEPYYQTWQADVHGSKLEVACVECHYAPGERTTVKAKLRGLSQAVSYFSGRYGKTRPRAYVDNQSCLTSKCHGDMGFMDKELFLGTVKFTHAKHLRVDEKKQEAADQELADLKQTFEEILGKERFGELQEAATLALPADDRLARMVQLLQEGKKIEPQQLARFSQLHHRQVRVAQLADLQCTNCHAYGGAAHPVAGQKAHHFSVKTSSCITCHFSNEGFNTGTTSCLLCHTLPTKEILVHQELTPKLGEKLKSPELAKKPVKIDHETIVKRKVDCFSCHADVARENTKVSRRDCERCHDQPSYFQKWKEPATVELVKHYHSVHVAEQRAKCLDCHSEVHHQLVRKDDVAGQPGFLASAMANCTHCHPNQHAEQVQLLSGVGSAGVPKGSPNLMFGARTNCFGCHVEQIGKAHEGMGLRGTESGCIACHGDRHTGTFEKWKLGIKLTLLDAEEAYASAQKMLQKADKLDEATRQKVSTLLNAAQADLQLVKRGNAVHNVNYSLDILDSITRRSQQAMALIAKAKKQP